MVMICGLPNAGKTTYSQQYDAVIHVDDLCARGKSVTQTLCEMVSKAPDDICVEGMLITAHQRKMLLQSSRSNHNTCIWLNTSLEECLARENRGRGPFIFNNCNMLFEPPTLAEGWDEIIIIKGENDVQRYNR